MPSPADILAGLAAIAAADAAVAVAVAWHALVAAGLVRFFYARGRPAPSRRAAALFIAAPIASAGVVAFAFGNVFNGAALTLTATTLSIASLRAPRSPCVRGGAVATGAGALLVAFAWSYPHFVGETSAAVWLFTAPMGTLPCPTLALAVGLTLLTGLPAGRAFAAVVAVVALWFGLFGALRLGVAVDVVLVAGAAVLALRSGVRSDGVPMTAMRSCGRFLRNVARGRIHQPRRAVRLDIDGGSFVAHRETVVDVPRTPDEARVVLAIRFRLWFVNTGSRLLAPLFWRVNIITVPFFSGCDGLVSKLWMEDRARAEYLGVYEFTSAQAALRYADFIGRVLRVFSKRGSIAHELVEGTGVERFLAAHASPPATQPPSVEGAPHAVGAAAV